MVFTTDDTHLPAAIMKKFLRELPDPLLTFALYDQVMDACGKFNSFPIHIYIFGYFSMNVMFYAKLNG